jgi:type I restriction enzyme S subunit
MSNYEWLEAPLDHFLTRATYGFTNPMPTTSEGPYMVTAKDVNDGRILYEQARRTSRSAYLEKLTDKSRPNVGDVLVTKDGTLGRIAIVDRPDVCVNQSVAVLQPKSSIRSAFLKLVLEEPRNHQRMLSEAEGSTIKHIYITRLAQQPVRVPSLAVKDAVLSLVSPLERRIDLNRRMNETLQAMARAIFKDWFVDFGPTRAKMEGRAPYLAPDIWSLFPDCLDAEGKPEGWIGKPLDQVADFLNGLALQKYPPNGGLSLPVIKIAQLRAGSVGSADLASSEISPNYIVEDGDVLFSWSGSLLHRVWTAGRGALNQHLFKVTSTQFPKWFYFYWIAEHMPSFQATAASKATTMGHIQRHHLTQAATVVGSPSIMEAADGLIAPLFDRQIANDLESRTLAATRDLLLPKLMSGEVRVEEAETVIDGAL